MTLSRSWLACLLLLVSGASSLQAASWQDVEAEANGQTVYLNAWGGDDKINAYIAWAGAQLKASHNIELVHVKLSDTASAVSRILAEQAAG